LFLSLLGARVTLRVVSLLAVVPAVLRVERLGVVEDDLEIVGVVRVPDVRLVQRDVEVVVAVVVVGFRLSVRLSVRRRRRGILHGRGRGLRDLKSSARRFRLRGGR